MKKLLTLVLCWLLAFSAIAETTFKAKTAASVAGGYVTSLNKVDGSFEDGSTQWSASVGTIVPTASTEFQGNNIGVWSGTGAGTLDLQWTATASNTYEASAQVDVQGEDDVYICAYVGTTETGCKLIPALSKIQKVSVVADSVMSSAFYLRLKHTGSDAFSVKVDDGKIEPWTPQAVNLNVHEYLAYSGYSSKNANNQAKFTTKSTKSDNSIVISDSNSGDFTKVTALKKCLVNVKFQWNGLVTTTTSYIYHYDSAGNVIDTASSGRTSSIYSTIPYTAEMNPGDYLAFVNPDGLQAPTNFSITASAISENVVQSTESKEEVVTISQAQNAMTDITGELRYALSSASVTVNGASKTAASSYSSKFLRIEDDGTRTKFIANQEIVLSVSALAGVSTVGYNIYIAKNGGSAYAFGSNGYTASALSSLSTEVHLLANEYISFVGNNALESGSTSFRVSLKISSPSTPTLLALPTSKENRFDGEFNAAGIIQQPNNAVIGNAVVSDNSLYTIPLQAGVFTVAPNVVASLNYNQAIGTGSGIIGVVSVSTTQVVVRTGYVDSNGYTVRYALPFTINVSKKSPDYTAPGVFVGNVQPEWQYDISSYVSGTNTWATLRAVSVIKKMGSGQYRHETNINGTVSGTSKTAQSITISSMVFKALGGSTDGMACSASTNTAIPIHAIAGSGTSTLSLSHASSATARYEVTCVGELESKPAFAVNTP